MCAVLLSLYETSRFDGRRVGSAKSDVWARQVKLPFGFLFSHLQCGYFQIAIVKHIYIAKLNFSLKKNRLVKTCRFIPCVFTCQGILVCVRPKLAGIPLMFISFPCYFFLSDFFFMF